MDVRYDIKAEVVRRGKKLLHLAESFPMGYSRLNQILNGFLIPPVGFDRRLKEIFEQWDREVKQ